MLFLSLFVFDKVSKIPWQPVVACRLKIRAGKTKRKDMKTAEDTDESGEVYTAKPISFLFLFFILLSAMPGELLCHCAGLLSVKRSLD